MSKKTEQTYVVVRPNTLDYAVGQHVEMTAERAATLVNKVALLADLAVASHVPSTADAELIEANETIKKLLADKAQLEATVSQQAADASALAKAAKK